MRARMGGFKLLLTIIFLLMGLTLLDSVVYAIDEAELKNEAEKAYQELKATDPEAAQEFIREYREAVKSGEITLEKADTESGKEIEERKVGKGERRYSEADSRKMDTEFNTLLKEGKSPQEAEKIMREKYGEHEGPQGPQDFDLSKPEDRAKALENLDKDSAFLKEKGLSDNDISQLKDAIARGDEDAEIFDKMDKMGLGPPEPGEFEGRGPGDRGPGDFERFGPPEGEGRGPGDFERHGPEGREISKEDMMEHFREEMGREPNEFEREMMERGDFDRPEYDRPEYDRPEFDRPEYDRPEYDRPEYDRPDREYDDRLPPPPGEGEQQPPP